MQILLQLLICRFCQGTKVLRNKFHLLPHATPNNHVVAVEPHCERFPVVNLLTQVIVDQTLKLSLCWWAHAGFLPRLNQSFKLSGGDNNFVGSKLIRIAEIGRKQEDPGSEQEKMQEWLFENSLDHKFSDAATRPYTIE